MKLKSSLNTNHSKPVQYGYKQRLRTPCGCCKEMKSSITRILNAAALAVFLILHAGNAAAQVAITAETALENYLQNNDTTFSWEVTTSFSAGEVEGYELMLTSQTWREHVWKHQLTVLVPRETGHDGALLFITGGSIQDGKIELKDKTDPLTQSLVRIAEENKAVVSIIRQVPNQPLFGGLTEDELISYTLHNFREDGDFTWPLLFPMVKSAVRAMDAVQAFSKEELGQDIGRFIVSGISKRGWTTWLTGASDERVAAIAPMVIDVLNMPVSLDYQIRVWDDYSPQIQDYVRLEIPQQAYTETGKKIVAMVDPYSYRSRLTMPKMIFNGTNDPYWPVDAVKHYYDSLPGENYLHYVPNAGHDLGDKKQAFKALSALFGYTLQEQPYPECSWEVSESNGKVKLAVQTSPDRLVEALVWSAGSDDRDFRDEKWKSRKAKTKRLPEITVEEDLPESGYKAFYVDLKYRDPHGKPYSKSTRMFVTGRNGIL